MSAKTLYKGCCNLTMCKWYIDRVDIRSKKNIIRQYHIFWNAETCIINIKSKGVPHTILFLHISERECGQCRSEEGLTPPEASSDSDRYKSQVFLRPLVEFLLHIRRDVHSPASRVQHQSWETWAYTITSGHTRFAHTDSGLCNPLLAFPENINQEIFVYDLKGKNGRGLCRDSSHPFVRI